jgi:carboxypeptidase D
VLKDKSNTMLGALVYDPTIGATTYTHEEAPAYPYVEYYNNIIGLNASFMATLKGLDESCGYAAYREKYYTFPAAGIQPPPPSVSDECDINGLASNAAFNINPCFNSYEINTQCPIPSGKIASSKSR